MTHSEPMKRCVDIKKIKKHQRNKILAAIKEALRKDPEVVFCSDSMPISARICLGISARA